MPSISERKKELLFWEKVMMIQLFHFLVPIEDRFGLGLFDDFGIIMYHYLLSQRYSRPRDSYRDFCLFDQFEIDLRESSSEDGGGTSFLNEREFRQKYRMSRESLLKLANLVKDHQAFNPGSKTRKQANPMHQLMCLLVYLSTEGSGASNAMLRSIFRKGHGTYHNFKTRCVDAIIDCLGKQYYNWPIDGEKKEIARRFRDEYGWPNCLGSVDGTLLPLAFPPETEDAPDYHGRKYRYSLSVLVVNDDKRRIRYFLAGWPGKTHDNRVLRNSQIGIDPSSFFLQNQYILADSAFEAQWFCIPAFKKPAGLPIPQHKSRFNDLLKGPRVISEHTIGMWKGRFPWLRNIRMKIKKDRKSLRQLLRVIKVTVILHNFLIEENDEFEKSWDDHDSLSDVDEAEDENDELNLPADHNSTLRREQLMNYFNERDML
jgi:hypothetical protein